MAQTSRRTEVRAGLLLVAAAVLGILAANTPLAATYDRLISTPVELAIGGFEIAKPLLLWINDGLMAVFFFVVALELKREILVGNLASRDRIALPLAAAVGGMVVPAAVYTAFNAGDDVAMQGWAIPAATDIAFALGVLAMLGDRVPPALKAFLLSVAVFDDVGAILVIAILYTDDVSWAAKGLAAVAAVGLFGLNRARVTRLSPYLALTVILWACVLKSGVHATLAGVVAGLTIPMHGAGGRSPLRSLEAELHPFVVFGILPVFAFANSGVRLDGLGAALAHPVTLGIAAGLSVGKLAGSFGAAWLLIRTGLARLPEGATRASLAGVCTLAGIGFTMSLFIGSLAFEHTGVDLSAPVRLGVLLGSAISAVAGWCLLRATTRETHSIEGTNRGGETCPETSR